MPAPAQITVRMRDRGDIQATVDALTVLAERDVRAGRAGHPYRSGVRYQREPHGVERWQTPSQVIATGAGDCEDLAAWLAGWYRAHGVDARAVVTRDRYGWHVVTLRGDRVEDPSVVLGME